MTTRRGLLGGLAGILASGFAPAAVSSGVLMPVRFLPVSRPIWFDLNGGEFDGIDRLPEWVPYPAYIKNEFGFRLDAVGVFDQFGQRGFTTPTIHRRVVLNEDWMKA